MTDKNPIIVSEGRKMWFQRILKNDGGTDPAELQRVQAELERMARTLRFRDKAPRRGSATKLEAFLPVEVGEPGSNSVRAAQARIRALRRSQRRQPRHGRQYVTR